MQVQYGIYFLRSLFRHISRVRSTSEIWKEKRPKKIKPYCKMLHAIINLLRAVKNIVLKTEYIYHLPRELILHSTYFALWNKFSSIGIWYIFSLQNNWYFSLLVISYINRYLFNIRYTLNHLKTSTVLSKNSKTYVFSIPVSPVISIGPIYNDIYHEQWKISIVLKTEYIPYSNRRELIS